MRAKRSAWLSSAPCTSIYTHTRVYITTHVRTDVHRVYFLLSPIFAGNPYKFMFYIPAAYTSPRRTGRSTWTGSVLFDDTRYVARSWSAPQERLLRAGLERNVRCYWPRGRAAVSRLALAPLARDPVHVDSFIYSRWVFASVGMRSGRAVGVYGQSVYVCSAVFARRAADARVAIFYIIVGHFFIY